MLEFSDRAGRLHNDVSNRRGGKRIAEWTFRTEKKAVKVEISMDSDCRLCASAPELNEAIFDTDMKRLFDTVEKNLLENIAEIVEVDWEDWLQVEILGGSKDFDEDRYSSPSMLAELKVVVTKIKRGIRRSDGKAVTINHNKVLVPFPGTETMATGDTLLAGMKNERIILSRARNLAFIPETAENMAALNDIISRMKMLHNRLKELLSQEAIQGNLGNVLKMLSYKED